MQLLKLVIFVFYQFACLKINQKGRLNLCSLNNSKCVYCPFDSSKAKKTKSTRATVK